MLRQANSRCVIARLRELGDPAYVDELVIEIEQRNHAQCVVERVRAECLSCCVDEGPPFFGLVKVRCIDEVPERLLAIGERSARQHPIDDVSSKKLRGDRRVRADSESAVILLRGDGGEELAFSGRKRPVAHHRLREREQMASRIRFEGE